MLFSFSLLRDVLNDIPDQVEKFLESWCRRFDMKAGKLSSKQLKTHPSFMLKECGDCEAPDDFNHNAYPISCGGDEDGQASEDSNADDDHRSNGSSDDNDDTDNVISHPGVFFPKATRNNDNAKCDLSRTVAACSLFKGDMDALMDSLNLDTESMLRRAIDLPAREPTPPDVVATRRKEMLDSLLLEPKVAEAKKAEIQANWKRWTLLQAIAQPIATSDKLHAMKTYIKAPNKKPRSHVINLMPPKEAKHAATTGSVGSSRHNAVDHAAVKSVPTIAPGPTMSITTKPNEHDRKMPAAAVPPPHLRGSQSRPTATATSKADVPPRSAELERRLRSQIKATCASNIRGDCKWHYASLCGSSWCTKDHICKAWWRGAKDGNMSACEHG